MTREKKFQLGLMVAGWLLGGVIQGASFIYTYGRLSQKVDDIAAAVQRLEDNFFPKTVQR